MWVEYYDASSLVRPLGVLCLLLGFAAFSVFYIKHIQEDEREAYEKWFELFKMYLITGFFILMALMVAIYSIRDYRSIKKIIKNKEYTEVEGYVEDFVQITKVRHPIDSFTVNKIRFSSDNGLDKTKAQGSPIYTGQYVKIHYFKEHILKLWVKEREYSRWYK